MNEHIVVFACCLVMFMIALVLAYKHAKGAVLPIMLLMVYYVTINLVAHNEVVKRRAEWEVTKEHRQLAKQAVELCNEEDYVAYFNGKPVDINDVFLEYTDIYIYDDNKVVNIIK